MSPAPRLDRRVVLILFAALSALGAYLIAQQWVAQQRRNLDAKAAEIAKEMVAKQNEPSVEVAVAAKDLPAETVLEMSHIRKGAFPQKFIQPYAARSPKDVIGKVTLAPIAEGEQLLTNKLRSPEEAPVGSTLSSVLPKGKRAVTIGVDSLTGVGGFVRPGDLVDILWSLKMPDATKKDGQLVTLTIFQDVSVLAVGASLKGPGASAGGSEKGGGSSEGSSVTLALTAQEASFLLFAREQGRIQLSLRPRTEGGSQALVPANLNTLLEMQLGIKAMQEAPPTKPGRQVEVFKGLKRESLALTDHEDHE